MIYESDSKSSEYEPSMKFAKDHRNKQNRNPKMLWLNPRSHEPQI